MFDILIEALAYPFVRYALITGVLIALCSSLLGVILVLKRIFIYRHTIQSVGYAQLAMILGFVELGARILTSFISIQIHNYYVAVASDPFAWVLAGICGLIIARVIFKKIEKRWAAEEPSKSPAIAETED